jgi:hypothetical protein
LYTLTLTDFATGWTECLPLLYRSWETVLTAFQCAQTLFPFPILQNQVARALTELGKLERTVFLLEYFRDAALRRRILIGLNKGEALHALARQLFFGRLGELRDRALEDQIHRASCLHSLMAAIAAWNTVYLTKAIATLRKRGEEMPEATVAHIAPLGREHIRLIGDYHFAPQRGAFFGESSPIAPARGGRECLRRPEEESQNDRYSLWCLAR